MKSTKKTCSISNSATIPHPPSPGPGRPRQDYRGVFDRRTLKSGEKSREVMWIDQIEEVRKASRSGDSGPWVTHYGEMAKKTVARRHSKVLPMIRFRRSASPR